MLDSIIVKGARVHNLKAVDVTIPRNKLIVFTGLSGSGKSSLAFDTIYAEGQRRYVESLSAYARQFLGQMDKPDVDSIDGLSPAISIDQKSPSHNPRSTVGTVTEIYDYLRLLFSSIGTPHCAQCGQPVQSQSVQEMVDLVSQSMANQKVTILAPVVREKKGEYKKLLDQIKSDGFSRVMVNGDIHRLDEPIKLAKTKQHSISVVVDRLSITDDNQTRLFESLETAVRYANGLALIEPLESTDSMLLSEQFSCPDCSTSLPEISPRLFSFNSPLGACSTCRGLGSTLEFDPELLVSDPQLSIKLATEKAINLNGTAYGSQAESLCQAHGFSLETPVSALTPTQFNIIFYGPPKTTGRSSPTWEGIIPNLNRRYKRSYSDVMRFFFRRYMRQVPCTDCHGARLSASGLGVTINGHSIASLCVKSVDDLIDFFDTIDLTPVQRDITAQVTKEISNRLSFLKHVGLQYLTLARSASSLSGGEYQRIRLATQIGAGLTGVLYVLDEPSIGLHQRDNQRLIESLIRLRDLGNTLIVVEHDEDTIRMADHVVDIGPHAGRLGGTVLFSGSFPELEQAYQSLTSDYMFNRRQIPIPTQRRPWKPNAVITLKGATEHNLKGDTATFPIGVLTCVTGVSGSGKSTLINDTLQRITAKRFSKSRERIGTYSSISGLEQLDKVITIDQSPIGRTPRSNPATYTGVFTPIRELMAQTNDAKVRGYKPGRFSFNVKGGRCESCEGDGVTKIEMHFLSDVYVTCDVCNGHRYNTETLNVKFKGYSISDILNMTINEALETCFEHIPSIAKKLQTLQAVGLGYIHLGQSATTLSGGEAQRIKLAKELSKTQTGKTLYLLDEPTTGLHFADIQNLIDVLQQLVDSGNTVIVIEHNLDVIKVADHIIDLGPDGGDGGGHIIAEGTPETVAATSGSYTGQFLAPLLKRNPVQPTQQTAQPTR